MPQRKLTKKIETWVFVTLIAMLVWLYAEATVLQQHTATIQVQLSDPTQRFAYEPTGNIPINVKYKASSGQHQQFTAKTEMPLVLDIDTAGVESTGNITMLMKDQIMRAGLGEIGITDFEVEESTRNVALRRLDRITLNITAKPPAGRTVDAETISPAQVNLPPTTRTSPVGSMTGLL